MIKIKTCRSKTSGRVYTEISDDKLCTAHNYFTVNSFTSDGKKIVLSSFENDGTTKPPCRYFVIDPENGSHEYIASAKKWETGSVSCDDKLYFSEENRLYCTDINTKKTELLWEAPDTHQFHGPVSTTNDGRYAGVYWSENEANSVFGVFDTQERKMKIIKTVSFMPPFTFADHGMICPTSPDLMFFAHEGSCFYITDRLWIMNTDTGETRNLFKQKLTQNGSNADCVGHECWKHDGTGLFFVKYSVSPEGPTGIYYTDLNGNSKCINSEASHWHVAPDRDGRYTVSDTGSAGVESDIILTNVKTGEAITLDHIDRWPNHPGHPHPCFSPEGDRVIYTFKKPDGNLAVAVMDISDLK